MGGFDDIDCHRRMHGRQSRHCAHVCIHARMHGIVRIVMPISVSLPLSPFVMPFVYTHCVVLMRTHVTTTHNVTRYLWWISTASALI